MSKLLLASLLLITIAGCGKKIILSDDAVRIRKTVDFVNELKELYEQRDEQMLNMFASQYLRESPHTKNAILRDMERFNSISLSLFIDRIEVIREDVNISIHWNGTWIDDKGTYREGGTAVMVTSYRDGLKIMDIKVANPFGISTILTPESIPELTPKPAPSLAPEPDNHEN